MLLTKTHASGRFAPLLLAVALTTTGHAVPPDGRLESPIGSVDAGLQTGASAQTADGRSEEAASSEGACGRPDSPDLHSFFFAATGKQGRCTITPYAGLESDLDLFVRRAQPAEWTDRSRGAGTRTVVIENPGSGAYYKDCR